MSRGNAPLRGQPCDKATSEHALERGTRGVTRREVAKKVITAPETAYRLDGAADAPVLLLSNGLAADLSMWDAKFPSWRRIIARCVTITEGMATRRRVSGPYSIDLLASDASICLTNWRSGKCISSACRLAARSGGCLPRLILSGLLRSCCAIPRLRRAGGLGDTHHHGLVTRHGAVGRADPRALAHSIIPRRFAGGHRAGGANDPPHLAGGIRRLRGRDPIHAADSPSASHQGADPGGRRRKDTATPPAMAERLAASIPGAELVVIKGAAHLPNIEQPETFNAAIGDFLRRHAGVRPLERAGGAG